MKYIKMYADQAAYDADNEKEYPHVGYIEATDEVKYINDMADMYDIYGSVTDGTSSMTIKINNANQNATVSNGKFMYKWTGGTITSFSFVSNSEIKKLVTVDKFDLDTSNLTSLQDLLHEASNLVLFDFSNFNTSNVNNMRTMFYNCVNLKVLDLSSFNTSGVTTTNGMFIFCSGLLSLIINNWDMSNVSDTGNMFYRCNSLQTVTMNNTNQTTFDLIKSQLVSDSVASHVTIIRDGLNWTYNGSQWVSQ